MKTFNYCAEKQQQAIAHLKPAPREKKVLFEIRSIEWMMSNSPENDHAHRQQHFEVIWITNGSGTLQIDLQQHEVKKNSIYCIAPGQVHHFNTNGETSGYVISFSAEFLYLNNEPSAPIFKKGEVLSLSNTAMSIAMNDLMVIETGEIVRQMSREFDNYSLLRADILRAFLRIFLLQLGDQLQSLNTQAGQSRNKELTDRFFSLVEKKFIDCKMVTDYANELAVTPNYLNEIIKKVTGYAASYHIQQRIVLEAKRFATYTNDSMKEIAYSLGFDDTAHFSKFFKNVCGMNFTTFKKTTAHPFSLS